jgi:hypothetical protein
MRGTVGAVALAAAALVVGACVGDDRAHASCWRNVADEYRVAGDLARPILVTYANNLGSRYGGLNQVASASDETYYDTYVRRDVHGLVQGIDQIREESRRFDRLRRNAETERATCEQSDAGTGMEIVGSAPRMVTKTP